MKFLDKLIQVVFSFIIILMAVVGCMIAVGWIDITTLYIIGTNILADQTVCNVIICVNAVLILLGIKGIFFPSEAFEDEVYKDGVMLENDDGKLLITKETLTSIVNSVVSGFESVKTSQTKIQLDEENNLSIILTIEVSNNAIIKELSNNIQIRVKDTIKKSLDVDVKNMDIRVKDMKSTTEETQK